MQFDVHTLGANEALQRHRVEAPDAAQARALVTAQVAALGQRVALVRPAGGGWPGWTGWRAPGLFGERSAVRFALGLFSQELRALLRAGLTLVEALEALVEKEGANTTRDVLSRLLNQLREGQRFSSALAQQSRVFSPLYIGLVRAAEGTSDLPRALDRYLEYDSRVSTIRAKVVSASIYPAILLAVGLLVSGFLVGYVVPRFAAVYEGTGRELPWLSQQMLDWGRFAGEHAAAVGAGAVAALALLVWGLRRLWAGGGAGALLALMPGVAPRVRLFELARLYLALGMLQEGGIPVLVALRSVEGLVSPRLRPALRAAGQAIDNGAPMSSAFEAAGLCTPISLRLLRVGERTGQMGTLLMQAAAFHDDEIGRWVERFTRSFEPLLMAAIGLVVGVIVLTLYMPIFDLAGNF
jgi:general secretion pathway protein F